MAITLGSYPQLRRSVLDEGVTLHQTVRKTRGTHVMSTHYRVYFQERQKRDRNIPRTHSRSLCRNLMNSPNHRALFPTSSTLCAPTRNPTAPLNLHRQLQISLWPLLLFSVSIIPPRKSSASHPWAGKVAVVTGSSRSIGAAAAKALGAAGANVVVNYATNASAAEGVVNAIKSAGQGDAIAVKADAFSVEGGKSLVDAAVAKWGRLDILVLTAGVMGSKPIADVDEAFFDQHMQFNVKAPLFTVKHALQHLGRTSLSLSL